MILQLMALNSLYCADVPLNNYSLTHSACDTHRVDSLELLDRRRGIPAAGRKLVGDERILSR